MTDKATIQDAVDRIKADLDIIQIELCTPDPIPEPCPTPEPEPTPEPCPVPEPERVAPIITSLTRVTGGVRVEWIQEPLTASNFDIVIDGNDPGDWRTTNLFAIVPEGKTYMVEARYPSLGEFLRSDPVDLPPLEGNPTNVDEYGIEMFFKTKSGGEVLKDPIYQRSCHGGKTRDTFWWNGADFVPMELTAYVATTIADSSDDVGFKIMGGRHSSSNPKAGRSYDIGLEAGTGRLYVAKEYPEHPKGDYDVRDKADFIGTPIGDIRNKLIGFKIINSIKNGVPTMELFIDKSPFVNGRPQNQWEKFGVLADRGQILGEPYLENQGVLYDGGAGKGKIYLRMDTVLGKSVVYGMTARELDDTPVSF